MPLRFRTAGLLATLAWCTLVSSPAVAQGVSVHDANDDQKAEAQVKFLEARKAFDARQFVDAITGFRSSFDVVASPNTHLMITHAMRALGRNAEAYEELGLVAGEAQAAAAKDAKYEQTVQLANDERASLREKIALLTVTVPAGDSGATLSVAGRNIPQERWTAPIAVDPGSVTVIYQGDDEPVVKQVEAEAGGEATVTIEIAGDDTPAPPPPPPPEEGSKWQWTGTQRYIAYGVAGLGVGAFIGSAVTGSMAASQHSELQDACGDNPCPERQDDIDSGKTSMLVTNVLIGAGAVLVAGGAVLWFLAPDEDAGSEEGVTGFGLGPGSFVVQGRF
jgi:hypothetical protein